MRFFMVIMTVLKGVATQFWDHGGPMLLAVYGDRIATHTVASLMCNDYSFTNSEVLIRLCHGVVPYLVQT